MDVRVYILDEAALVVLTIPAHAAGSGLLEASLRGYSLHPAANGLYDFVALRH
jgi:hypothetical protein